MSASDAGVKPSRVGSCLVLAIDRPERRNALSIATAGTLRRLVDEASADSSVRAVIITGTGSRVFVSGGDLHEFSALSGDPAGAGTVLEMGAVSSRIERCAVPVIAAVQGAALGGGCELLLACDLVVADARATFAFRQVAMGLSTGWGGGTRLVERVGPMRAARLLLTGEEIGAEQALEMGLVSEVTPPGKCLERALELAERMATHRRDSVAGIKRMLAGVREEGRGRALAREAEVFEMLWGGPGHRAAMEAFLGRTGPGGARRGILDGRRATDPRR